MISWNDYLLFIPAVIVITLLPGPDFAITVRTTLVHGRRAGILCLLGINLGVAMHTTAAILGISALIMGSQELFNILKWAGAVYLFWLGIGAIRESFQKKPGVPGTSEKWLRLGHRGRRDSRPSEAVFSAIFSILRLLFSSSRSSRSSSIQSSQQRRSSRF